MTINWTAREIHEAGVQRREQAFLASIADLEQKWGPGTLQAHAGPGGKEEVLALLNRAIKALDDGAPYSPVEVKGWVEDAIRLLQKENLTAAGDEPGQHLSAAVEKWLRGSDHSLRSWQDMLRSTISDTASKELTEYINTLRKRGFTISSLRAKRISRAALKDAIDDTDDIRRRLLNAEDDTLTAALGLRSLLKASHQRLVESSIVQAAKDKVETAVFAAQRLAGSGDVGFTGRRRFEAGDTGPDGRHSAIHRKVLERDEEFWELPERRIGNKVLPAKKIRGPRDNPADAAEWSNSKSRTTYEHRDRVGRLTWR